MELLNKIRDFIQDLEEKEFYKYLIIVFICLFLVISFIVFRYYRKINYLKGRIEEVNNIRVDDVQVILSRADVVKKEREEVNVILAKEEDFKIGGYFDNLLKKLGLSGYFKDKTVSPKEISDQYRESELSARLSGMNTKQLCELLEELEKKKRIYTKVLEIKKSKRKPKGIDVSLTIATLQPKAEAT